MKANKTLVATLLSLCLLLMMVPTQVYALTQEQLSALENSTLPTDDPDWGTYYAIITRGIVSYLITSNEPFFATTDVADIIHVSTGSMNDSMLQDPSIQEIQMERKVGVTYWRWDGINSIWISKSVNSGSYFMCDEINFSNWGVWRQAATAGTTTQVYRDTVVFARNMPGPAPAQTPDPNANEVQVIASAPETYTVTVPKVLDLASDLSKSFDILVRGDLIPGRIITLSVPTTVTLTETDSLAKENASITISKPTLSSSEVQPDADVSSTVTVTRPKVTPGSWFGTFVVNVTLGF